MFIIRFYNSDITWYHDGPLEVAGCLAKLNRQLFWIPWQWNCAMKTCEFEVQIYTFIGHRSLIGQGYFRTTLCSLVTKWNMHTYTYIFILIPHTFGNELIRAHAITYQCLVILSAIALLILLLWFVMSVGLSFKTLISSCASAWFWPSRSKVTLCQIWCNSWKFDNDLSPTHITTYIDTLVVSEQVVF